MAWALASSLLSGKPEPARSRLALKKTIKITPPPQPIPTPQESKPAPPRFVQIDVPPSEFPLPIFVPLASFARYRRKLPGNAPPRERTLAHFISYHLTERQADFDLPADFFVQVLQDGRDILLLLDGLDEVANESERFEVRQCVEDLVGGREAMRVLVTCRTAAYRSGRTALGADFREILVRPLDFEGHIAPMVRQAYDCIYPHDTGLRDERATDLLEGIRRLEQDRRTRLGKDAEALVDSPLIVRLLLIVHFNNRRLPDERADLFDKAINALLQVDYGREEGDIRELSTDWKPFRDMAQHLAFHMHGQGRDQGREIEEAALKAALRREVDFKPRIDDFLQSARQRGSVLEERTGVYRFIHLAFQEFLAARYLGQVTMGAGGLPAIVKRLEGHLNDPWWREPILLLAGYLGVHSPTTARKFLAALARAGETPDARIAAAELAGIAALEWRESGEPVKAECAARIIAALGDGSTPNECRASVRVRVAGLVPRLGGDPRFDPGRYHLPGDDWLGFVPIDADPQFRIGTRPSDRLRVARIIGYDVPDHEINDAPTPTPAFYIARYLVTVGQFRAFLAATRTEPRDPKALDDPESRPVRYIDWWEAMAYCRWLHRALADGSVLAGSEAARLVRKGSWQVSLPGEREWEVAARGGRRGSVCPWGDMPNPDAANYGESNIRDTSSVGCFLANGFGLYDMVGNVWEWTRSLWALDYSQVNDPRREDLDAGDSQARVVRGGSWLNVQGLARCACRAMLLPDGRSNLLGFRVVLRAAPVSSTPISVAPDAAR
ncbi:SUMF1/EgtB/PvdO family nonheme iron enzyme [uncultured Thiodictyon sp.]|jgi:hypothetical protein|uniref:SUMF1/EgtB/PvdO family nonheme iron enzyme n=1 Tax=uncultured Thiodictyon sp. TaxID=1846217 RepID=UPI0025DACEFF|nr:SUMF1/EgtB/PvdO family nonheme iron enzyme [uncultured Thiodictyon sp.]